ncbi:MAG: 2-oxo acid dehydrogenase subunit E2 [Candidatus Hydrogenedentes bacterium]|nr:2-oxo acid dehydrogenase subunit E2 [Candidatus Hydrogenedentota bacterium]
MIKEFRLPTLGENVKEATIGKITVKVGDIVRKGQTVIEIETDKAVAEIPISFEGRVVEINIKEGQKVKPGELILKLEEITPQETGTTIEPPVAEKEPQPYTTPVKTPLLTNTVSEKIYMTSEVKLSPPSPTAPSSIRKPGAPIIASPSVRRLARELGVTLEEVPTSDPSGRITAEDIIGYKKLKDGGEGTSPTSISITSAESPITTITRETSLEQDSWGPIIIEPMSTIRRKTAEQMDKSWHIPQVTHFDKANITQLEELRVQLSEKYKLKGIRISILSFLIKVSAEALKKFPKFNATIDLEKEAIIYKKYYNIGIAVDTEHGLLVPVLKDADKKSILQISQEIQELAEKARNRKLTIEEFQGGTFTISNLGGLGGIGFTPIVNSPQVAILGASKSNIEPVYKNGNFTPQLMLPLSLSYDHRLIDGAETARALRWICNALENPWWMFVE